MHEAGIAAQDLYASGRREPGVPVTKQGIGRGERLLRGVAVGGVDSGKQGSRGIATIPTKSEAGSAKFSVRSLIPTTR